MSLNPRLQDWADRTAWVVGASTGIGRATASHLHRLGAQVFVSARNEAALQEFVRDHPGSVAVPLDVTDRDAVAAAHAQVMRQARAGGLDLVMYCAGYYQPMRVETFDLDEVLRHERINVGGAWHVLAAVLPTLRRQGHGHLSLVASVAGFRGLPKALAYGPTKAALINLGEALHVELQPHHVGVSVVNPGFVDTPLTRKNTFPMPFLITAEKAAQEIITGLEKGEFEIHFPKAFTRTLRTLRILPYSLYFAAVRKITANKNKAELGHEQSK